MQYRRDRPLPEKTLHPCDAYRIMLRDYPDVLNIEQMCKILGLSLIHICKISGYTAQLRNGEILKVSEKDYKAICAEYLMWKGRRL